MNHSNTTEQSLVPTSVSSQTAQIMTKDTSKIPCKNGSECKFGPSKCRYSHSNEQIFDSNTVNVATKNTSQILCKNGAECKFGSKCKYLHREYQQDKICKYGDTCKYIDSCRYKHLTIPTSTMVVSQHPTTKVANVTSKYDVEKSQFKAQKASHMAAPMLKALEMIEESHRAMVTMMGALLVNQQQNVDYTNMSSSQSSVSYKMCGLFDCPNVCVGEDGYCSAHRGGELNDE